MTEDPSVERLLRLSGRRPGAPRELAASVRAAVHEAWRGEVRRRQNRQNVQLAAAIALAGAGMTWAAVSLTREPAAVSTAIVASLERVEGASDRTAGAGVRANEWITTGVASRLALRTSHGTSIRLDEQSRARLTSDAGMELAAGAVYVDVPAGAPSVEVRTPGATITDVGTQFEVRLAGAAVRVRVRSGDVLVRHGAVTTPVRAQTELALTPGGVESRAIEPFGVEWAWSAAVAPRLRFDGQRLDVFLWELAREQGWDLRYEDEALKRASGDVVLHGQAGDVDAEKLLRVALTIAGRSYTLERGELTVRRLPSSK